MLSSSDPRRSDPPARVASLVAALLRARALAAALAIAVSVTATAPPALATAITVTTTDDENNSDGDCSLREAIIAANTNTANDGCPAGQATVTDTITLADGAVYALGLPGANQPAQGGDLDIVHNTVALDVLIQVGGGGHATIAQDPTLGESIFALLPNASLEVDDVTLSGGRTAPGSGGGVAVVPSGSSLTLRRCTLTDNRAGNLGGALLVGGAVDLQGTLVAKNGAGNGAGAILVLATGSATIADSAFFDNDGGSQGAGGAIANSGTLVVSGTSFVDNRSKSAGGAIANEGGFSVTSSCFVGNSPHAVVNNGPKTPSATASWWGAKDGPGGAGLGHGDSVGAQIDFSGFLSAPPGGCLPLELVADGGFEIDAAGDGFPDRWTASHLAAPADGAICPAPGKCTFKMKGAGVKKSLSQVLRLAGFAGDAFTFSARSKAFDVPAGAGLYRARLALVHADGTAQNLDLDFDAGTHGFQSRQADVTAEHDFIRMRVFVIYKKTSGKAVFDDVSVVALAE